MLILNSKGLSGIGRFISDLIFVSAIGTIISLPWST